MQGIVVITTVGSEAQANAIAQELVAKREAACVNIIAVQRSIYRWQDSVCDDSEFLLLVKSTAERYQAIEATIQELHEYDVPEILAFNVGRGEQKFLDWIVQSTTAPSGPRLVDESEAT